MIGHEFLDYIPKIKQRSIYEEEFKVIRKFNTTEAMAVKLMYPNSKKATTARTVILRFISRNRMPLDATQRENSVIVFKK